MKLSRKSLILLFFLFNLAYIQCFKTETLPTAGFILVINGNETTQIQLDESQYTYQHYIGIILSKAQPPNPYIYIALSSKPKI